MKRLTGGGTLLNVKEVLNKAGISDKMKVADLGCGATGYFAFGASIMVGEKGMVYAVDILKKTLSLINHKAKQENIKNIKTIWSDLEVFKGTKIESSSLDVALLINTLSQSQKRVQILREAIRMLKKEGRITVVEWKKTNSPFGPAIKERVDMKSLELAAPKLGLKFEEEFFMGDYHYGLIFTKL